LLRVIIKLAAVFFGTMLHNNWFDVGMPNIVMPAPPQPEPPQMIQVTWIAVLKMNTEGDVKEYIGGGSRFFIVLFESRKPKREVRMGLFQCMIDNQTGAGFRCKFIRKLTDSLRG
jgi:hypothetical protein